MVNGEASAGVWHRMSSPTDVIIIKYKNGYSGVGWRDGEKRQTTVIE